MRASQGPPEGGRGARPYSLTPHYSAGFGDHQHGHDNIRAAILQRDGAVAAAIHAAVEASRYRIAATELLSDPTPRAYCQRMSQRWSDEATSLLNQGLSL